MLLEVLGHTKASPLQITRSQAFVSYVWASWLRHQVLAVMNTHLQISCWDLIYSLCLDGVRFKVRDNTLISALD